MTPSIDIALTDDEVVALAQRWETVWHAPLPTVDTGDTDKIAQAVIRGWRSLLVRGLLEPVANSQLTDLRPVFTNRPSLAACYVNDQLLVLWDKPALVMHGPYGDSPAVVSETVTPGGVHRFTSARQETCLRAMAQWGLMASQQFVPDVRVALLRRAATGVTGVLSGRPPKILHQDENEGIQFKDSHDLIDVVAWEEALERLLSLELLPADR